MGEDAVTHRSPQHFGRHLNVFLRLKLIKQVLQIHKVFGLWSFVSFPLKPIYGPIRQRNQTEIFDFHFQSPSGLTFTLTFVFLGGSVVFVLFELLHAGGLGHVLLDGLVGLPGLKHGGGNKIRGAVKVQLFAHCLLSTGNQEVYSRVV